ncbi:MAG: threonine ammonia-lyase IlvA [Bowdeniella nasicola]|nr:threonine ammonia-lyase IlvA [Bowdeniella nasicola]
MHSDLTPANVVGAAQRLGMTIRQTTLDLSLRLSGELRTPVYLKREDLQVGRSYKVRGAYTMISALSATDRQGGVACASAGNHAQGVAFACRQLRIRGKVFLPTTTPRQKRDRIAAIGGQWIEQVIGGLTFDETSEAAQAYAREAGATYVPPFDHPQVILGQATVGKEILDQASAQIGTIVVPVGGGGLAAGIALWCKHVDPSITIIGAEPEGAASMQAALQAGHPVKLDQIDPFVDGAAVGRVGALPYRLLSDLLDHVVSVPIGAVCTEMLDLYQTEGIIAEPAGALASAAVRRYLPDIDRERGIVAVVSGGNNDVSRYADVLERSLVHEGLRHYFLVTFPQQPGALRTFLDHTLGTDDDIVLFEYTKKTNRETGPALVGIDIASPTALPPLLERMATSPLQIEKLAPDSPVFEFLL